MEQTQYKHGTFAYRSPKELKKHPNNPRFILDEDFERLVESVKKLPDLFEGRPIIISDRTGELIILAGNQKYDVAKYLKLKTVPTFLIPNLSEAQEQEIIIRDNITNGQWDWNSLNAPEWADLPLEEWGLPPMMTINEPEEDNEAPKAKLPVICPHCGKDIHEPVE
ncbi:MAG: hypothetical protein WC238_04720 [Parcubacteria group bacterium]|jgi:hypothetical protein